MAESPLPAGSRRNGNEPEPRWRVEGAPPGTPGSTPKRRPPLGSWQRFALVAVGILLFNQWAFQAFNPQPTRIPISYNTFRDLVDEKRVAEVTTRGDTITGEFVSEQSVTDEDGVARNGLLFRLQRPSFGDGDDLTSVLRTQGVQIVSRPPNPGPGVIGTILFSFGPTLLFIGLLVMVQRKMMGAMGGGGLGGLGRSKAKRYEQGAGPRVTFEDVAGIDDAEEELVEIVDFLKNPDKYRKLGAAIPKGVLLSGPPGTGKTLLARAVAGEANVPFFSMSASEFVEMIVGVGASRVRDLFTQTKAVAPAIIFIDEIDAIGRSRGGSSSIGGHDEREQTLNQILTEMDGFTGSEGVIVLAATNRPEILDQALLRPGRFDRRVVVSPPDAKGRELILQVHTKSVPLAADVDLAGVASTTPGMVGADLKNLVNEAALLAAKRGKQVVSNADFTDAMEKIVLGTERRIVLSKEERERTAFHEAGHALLGMLQPGADPVRKISIVPRGSALGVTFQAPDNDKYSYDAVYLRGRIIGALGGRAAEEVVYGNVTTGAESDLDMVTRIARSMVGRWGMSEAIGPLTVLPGPNDQMSMFGESPMAASQQTRTLIDSEIRRIVEECYTEALRQLREHRTQLDALVAELLKRETLDEVDAYAAAGIVRPERVVLS